MRHRTIMLHLRITEDKLEHLKILARECGESQAELLRERIARCRVQRYPEEDIQVLAERVRTVGISLNQLAMEANARGVLDEYHYDRRVRELEDIRRELEELFPPVAGAKERPELRGPPEAGMDRQIEICLSEDEADRLAEIARMAGLKKSAAVRVLLAGGQIWTAPPVALWVLLDQLRRLTVNLEQIAAEAEKESLWRSEEYRARAEEWSGLQNALQVLAVVRRTGGVIWQ